KIKVNDILKIEYYWLAGAPHHVIMNITGHSSGTVTDYIGYFRGMVSFE
ncbi:4066_t:CDS:1, partial [Dentiscutata erythropus]